MISLQEAIYGCIILAIQLFIFSLELGNLLYFSALPEFLETLAKNQKELKHNLQDHQLVRMHVVVERICVSFLSEIARGDKKKCWVYWRRRHSIKSGAHSTGKGRDFYFLCSLNK